MTDQPPQFGPFVPDMGTGREDATRQFVEQLHANAELWQRLADVDVDRLEITDVDDRGRVTVSLDGELLFAVQFRFPDLS